MATMTDIIDVIINITTQGAAAAGAAVNKALSAVGAPPFAMWDIWFQNLAVKIRRASMHILMLQMGMLGMYFSFMSFFNLIRSGFEMVTAQLKDLDTLFKNIAMGMAFVNTQSRAGKALRENLAGMLKDSRSIVDAWKNYTGAMAAANSIMTKLAITIFTNDLLMEKVYDIINKLFVLVSDEAFISSVLDIIEFLIDSMPDIVADIRLLVGLLHAVSNIPGMSDLIAALGTLAIISAILMPPLAAVQMLLQWIAGAFDALGIVLIPATAALNLFYATLYEGFIETMAFGTPLALLSVEAFVESVGGGLLLGLAGVWLLIASGAMEGIANFGRAIWEKWPLLWDFAKFITAPIAMFGHIFSELASTGVKIIWDFIKILQNEGLFPALGYLWEGLKYLGARILAGISIIASDTIIGILDMIDKFLHLPIVSSIAGALGATQGISSLKSFFEQSKRNANSWAQSMTPKSFGISESAAQTQGTYGQYTNVYQNVNIGTLNAGDIPGTMDALRRQSANKT